MEGKNNNLDELFSLARNEKARVPVEQMEQALETGIALSGGSAVSSWSSFFTLKTAIIMIGTSVVLIGTFLFLGNEPITERTTSTQIEPPQKVMGQVAASSSETDKLFVNAAAQESIPLKQSPHTTVLKTQTELVVDSPEVNMILPKRVEQTTAPLPSSERPILTNESAEIAPEQPISSGKLFTDGSMELVSESPRLQEFVEESAESEEPMEVRFIINSKSTTADLETMMAAAEKAGIRMNYEAKVKRNLIKRLHMHMSIKHSGEKLQRRVNIYAAKRGNFTTTIVWRVDENGKAVDFGDDTEKTGCSAKSSCK